MFQQSELGSGRSWVNRVLAFIEMKGRGRGALVARNIFVTPAGSEHSSAHIRKIRDTKSEVALHMCNALRR